jgi:membrane associated rhomboid family serine protease
MLNPVLIIIGINLLLYIATNISSGLVYDLGLYSSFGEFFNHPWGIFTSMFVHEEFFHLFANMLTLYFFGSFLIRLIGDRRFWLVYLGGGILGNILFVLLTSNALAIGASGAVFALGGALSILKPNLKVYILFIPVPVSLWIAVIGGFLLMSFLPYVAWQAHLGGLLFGLAVGYFIKRRGRYYF